MRTIDRGRGIFSLGRPAATGLGAGLGAMLATRVPEGMFTEPIAPVTEGGMGEDARRIFAELEPRLGARTAAFRKLPKGAEKERVEKDLLQLILTEGETRPGQERAFLEAMRDLVGAPVWPTTETVFSEGGARHLEDINRFVLDLAALDERKRQIAMFRDRADSMNGGVSLWDRSYRLGLGESGAMSAALEDVRRWTDEHVLLTDVALNAIAEEDPKGAVEQARLRLAAWHVFLARWADATFPIVQASHTLAAALACTDVHREAVEGIVPPWGAARFEIPSGLMGIGSWWDLPSGATGATEADRQLVREGKLDLSHVDLLVLDNGAASLFGHVRLGFRAFYLEASSLTALLSTEVEDPEDLGVEERLADAARRLVAGLLLAMAHKPGAVRERAVSGRKANPRDRGEPGHRRVVVGSPVQIDARPALAMFLKGERLDRARRQSGVGAIQWLVRGHWRNQAHGKGRLLRKVVWIEPHFAGNPDGAISARPKVLGG